MTELDLPACWPPCYPPHRPLSRAESNALDRQASEAHGIPSIVLMEHASRGIARIAERLAGPRTTFLALCGPGNNGGDGYGAARFLRSWGRRVEVVRCAPRGPAGGDAALEQALAAAGGPVVDAWEHPEAVRLALEDASVVVLDALFGLNLDASRPLAGPYLEWIRAMNASGAPCIAVDVPSGMDAETGAACPEAVRAHVTACMAAPKRGFAAAPELCGHVIEVDIGLPRALHAEFLAAS